MLRSAGLIVFCLSSLAAVTCHANQGPYFDTPDLNDNDRFMLCIGYSPEECTSMKVNPTAAAMLTDKNGNPFFGIELRYTVADKTCSADFQKYYGDMTQFGGGKGWIALGWHTGYDCTPAANF